MNGSYFGTKLIQKGRVWLSLALLRTNFGSRESRILQWREWFPQTSNLNHQKSEFRGKLYEAVGL